MIMSAKVYDHKGRWRNKTVAFRVSPEEAAHLDILYKLSGLTKQDYLIRRVLEKEVIVMVIQEYIKLYGINYLIY